MTHIHYLNIRMKTSDTISETHSGSEPTLDPPTRHEHGEPECDENQQPGHGRVRLASRRCGK